MLPTKKLTKSGKERVTSVSWSDRMRNQFILAMKTAAAGTSCSTGFKSEEWTAITNDFNSRTEMSLSRQQLQNQHTTLKAGYSVYHTFLSQSGFGVDNQTKLVTAEPAALKEYFAAHPKAKEYEFKPLMFYDLLHELFEGAIATGKYAVNFASPPAVVIGAKRGFDLCDVEENTEDVGVHVNIRGVAFNDREPETSDSEGESQTEQVNEQAAVKVKTSPATNAPKKEKGILSVTRLLGNIVNNQQKLIDRLPNAISEFENNFSDDVSVVEKIKFKRFLAQDNNADVFLLCNAAEKAELVKDIIA